MKASFVIATYNRVDDLVRCLNSVLAQEDCEIEIIVVDDASNDGTPDRIKREYGESVRLVIRESNCGSIKNRNYGAGLASGEVLFLIDDDTELPGVRTASEVLREFSDPLVGAVAIPYFQEGKLHCNPVDPAVSGRFAVASYVGCASAVRRVAFIDFDGYEEFFHHQVEEDDFCIRMLNGGMACIVGRVSEPMVHYESPMRNFFKWDYYGRRNSILYIWKNCPSAYFVQNLVMTSLRGLLHSFRVRRIRGNVAGLLAGYLSIMQSLVGKGCKRNPVRREIYDLTRYMRKKALPLSEVERLVDFQ